MLVRVKILIEIVFTYKLSSRKNIARDTGSKKMWHIQKNKRKRQHKSLVEPGLSTVISRVAFSRKC